VLVSGIKPSGRLHVGNYLGALKHFVELQDSGSYDPFFFIADLHSLTENLDPLKKREEIIDLAASYLAAGLDPQKSTLFIQSAVPAHAELGWIFNCITPLGELYRMTQFKDKAAKGEKEQANAGLLTYPPLMAADILLYSSTVVPVGDDQVQHLELTRTIARKFNRLFGETFREPKPLLTETPRIMSLTDPKKKMSKSIPAGCLFMDDSPKEIEDKVMRAVTDSGSEVSFNLKKKPAVSNLLLIYSSLSGMAIKDIEKQFAGSLYGPFKKALAAVVVQSLKGYRERKARLMLDTDTILKPFTEGAERAHMISSETMRTVRKKIGLLS
jgi:tryptophanyl-tRNA synthetase